MMDWLKVVFGLFLGVVIVQELAVAQSPSYFTSPIVRLTPGTYATLVTGQAKIVTTGTAVTLVSTATLANGIVVVAPSSNAATIYVGGAAVANTGTGNGNGIALEPGRSFSVQITSPSLIYINGTAGDWVSYAGN